jgi:glutaredoxin
MVRRWRLFGRTLPLRRVTLYSRPGCHLCDDARDLLTHLRREFNLVVTEVDIRQDPDLVRRYDIVIPVLVLEDGTELSAPLREQAVRTALKGVRS